MRPIEQNRPRNCTLMLGKILHFDQHGRIFEVKAHPMFVSYVQAYNGIFDVKAAAGDTHLGGEDFGN